MNIIHSVKFIVIIITNDTVEYTQSSLQHKLSNRDFQPTDLFVNQIKCHHFSQYSEDDIYLICSTAPLSSWNVATFSHQQVMDLMLWEVQTETAAIRSRCYVSRGCKQAESGKVMLWSTAQLQTANQRDRHWGTYSVRTFLWTSCLHSRTLNALISTSSDCRCLSAL